MQKLGAPSGFNPRRTIHDIAHHGVSGISLSENLQAAAVREGIAIERTAILGLKNPAASMKYANWLTRNQRYQVVTIMHAGKSLAGIMADRRVIR